MNTQIYRKINSIINQQAFADLIGMKLQDANSGDIWLSCQFNKKFTQQQGFIHGGIIAGLADAAAGFAAISVVSDEYHVMSVEFKLNLLRPANAKEFLAHGTVLKAGKRLIITEATVADADTNKLIAKMSATMIPILKETESKK